MNKYRCKVKFYDNKIVCASQFLCSDCPQISECEDIDLYIDEKYDCSKDCMTHDSHKRKGRRIVQRRWRR